MKRVNILKLTEELDCNYVDLDILKQTTVIQLCKKWKDLGLTDSECQFRIFNRVRVILFRMSQE